MCPSNFEREFRIVAHSTLCWESSDSNIFFYRWGKWDSDQSDDSPLCCTWNLSESFRKEGCLCPPLKPTWLIRDVAWHWWLLLLFFKIWFKYSPHWASLVAQRLKRLPPMRETWLQSLGREDPLEKEMVTHSSILAWRIPRTEKPGRLQSTGSQRVGHDCATYSHSLTRT